MVDAEYSVEDGFDDTAGLEQCPVCETTYSINSSFYGPVWDDGGNRYEYYTETDPMDGPFFCEDCWPRYQAHRAGVEHTTLDEFGGVE
jgi:hypothetical protein